MGGDEGCGSPHFRAGMFAKTTGVSFGVSRGEVSERKGTKWWFYRAPPSVALLASPAKEIIAGSRAALELRAAGKHNSSCSWDLW